MRYELNGENASMATRKQRRAPQPEAPGAAGYREVVMPETRKPRESQADLAERGILAHIEHLRAIGEALTEAADTFMREHRASQAEGDWRDDLGRNLAEAGQEFHRSLSASSQKVFDAYFGEREKPPEEPKA
jgi:hypothetical protein